MRAMSESATRRPKARADGTSVGLLVPGLLLVALTGHSLWELPPQLLEQRPQWLGELIGESTAAALRFLWPVLLLFPVLGLILSRESWSIGRRRVVAICASASVVGHSFWILASMYRRLNEWWVFTLLAFFVAVGILMLTPPAKGWSSPWLRRLSKHWPLLTGLAGVIGFLFVTGFSAWKASNLFPGFHLSLLEIATLALGMGLITNLRALPRAAVWIGAPLLAAITLIPAAGQAEEARPHFRGHTTLGRAYVAFEAFNPEREQPSSASASRVPADQALEVFARKSGLPQLPPDFDLADYDLLLVTIETTRADEAKLGEPDSPMPNLSALASQSMRFDRAYSPSSGTFQSSASLMGMDIPSALPLTTWSRSWHGVFGEDTDTAAEWFGRMNYRTWWSTHDFIGIFSAAALGLERGFDWRQLVITGRRESECDVSVADKAIEFSQAARNEGRRYFGWAFFVSPHEHYLVHDEEAPASTPRERYRQELRFSDAQLGRLLDELRASERWDETIVIVTADHGEEFRDHGNTLHGSALWEESVHVPLVVRVPGLRPQVFDRPTSTAYLLPWLFLRAPQEVRALAEARVQESFAPVMQALNGGVLVEMIGHYRMHSALIWQDEKLIYDFVPGLTALYDLQADPGERQDLSLSAPARLEARRPELDAYLDLRAHRRRYAFTPERTPDRTQPNWQGARDEINRGPGDQD
jgi:arylsulfatase A-like enzyme